MMTYAFTSSDMRKDCMPITVNIKIEAKIIIVLALSFLPE
jgi:hypothetical protein